KPALYSETFYDRKSRYSLNCQVSCKPHVMHSVLPCYPGGHYATQSPDCQLQPSNPAAFILCDYWMWANSTYP
ncbi:hypothetical protein PAXRUDRAFT_125525, partial [Paxillus rubicundulus Ve08.2h10]